MLELVNISLSAGSRQLVSNGISARVQPGSTIVFLGRNGTGKTTLLRNLAGHIRTNAGGIHAFGKTLAQSGTGSWAKTCCYITGKEYFVQTISTYEYLLSARLGFTGGLGLYSTNDYAVTDEWIAKTGIGALAAKPYPQLSEGEKQLVSIARAFIYQTPLVLLDEPTSNLDLPNKKTVTALLHTLATQENKIIIYSTHDYHISREYCRHVWFINNRGEFGAGLFSDMQYEIEKDFGLTHG